MISNPDIGKTPISPAAPAGEDPKFDPLFESISNEIAKIGSPTADSPTDWNRVVTESETLLKEKAKHLLVACYLSIGLIRTDEWDGFHAGIRVLADMVETFWDSFFPPPKRMKGRVNAIDWWFEKLQQETETLPSVIWEEEKKSGLIAALKQLDACISEKMPDAPMLRPMIDKIDRLVDVSAPPAEEPEQGPAPEPAPPAAQEKPPPAPSGPAARPEPDPPRPSGRTAPPKPREMPNVEIPKDGDPGHTLRVCLDAMGSLATMLRKDNPFDPRAFRMSRIAAWMPVTDPPPASGGQTMIPPPVSQVVTILNSAWAASNWENLLDAAESYVRQYLFWLDLSFYVHSALDGLNQETARDMVALETWAFVSRLPGIQHLAFSDGTPFAGPETLAWLKTLSSKGNSGEGSGESGPGDAMAQKVSEQIQSASALLKENRLDDAIGPVRDGLRSAASIREKYLWSMGMIEILIRARLSDILPPQIDTLLDMTDTYRIAEFEPDLALKGLTLAVTGLRLSDAEGEKERIGRILKEVARIDPVSAIGLIR